jgi:hypothetical protein
MCAVEKVGNVMCVVETATDLTMHSPLVPYLSSIGLCVRLPRTNRLVILGAYSPPSRHRSHDNQVMIVASGGLRLRDSSRPLPVLRATIAVEA